MHFTFFCSPGEYVSLVRQPENPYDRNAIQVLNMQGQQVGHIKKQAAAVLSPLLQKWPHLKADGTIPRPGSQWDLPLQISFASPRPLDGPLLAKALSRIQKQPRPKKSEPPPQLVTRRLDISTQGTDDYFQQQDQQVDQDWPPLPSDWPLSTKLLEHQVFGVQWMIQRETKSDQIPSPFYQTRVEHGKQVYYCSVTHASQPQAPPPCMGGLLCDDM